MAFKTYNNTIKIINYKMKTIMNKSFVNFSSCNVYKH